MIKSDFLVFPQPKTANTDNTKYIEKCINLSVLLGALMATNAWFGNKEAMKTQVKATKKRILYLFAVIFKS